MSVGDGTLFFLMIKWYVVCGMVLFGKCLIKSTGWQEKALAWKEDTAGQTSALLMAINPCWIQMYSHTGFTNEDNMNESNFLLCHDISSIM